MSTTYSLYDAKTRFSEVIRKVRNGGLVVITYRGREIAEIRPVAEKPARFEDRLKHLEDRSVVSPAPATRPRLRSMARRPGALKRFLDERE